MTDPLREAARAAIAALERIHHVGPNDRYAAANDLRAALAQPEPAIPAGWVPLRLEWEPGYPEDVAFGPPIMMDRLKKWLDKHFAQITAPQPAIPAGPEEWRLVPVEPTQTMCQEGQWKAKEWPKFPLRIVPIYKAMLAAAPTARIWVDRGVTTGGRVMADVPLPRPFVPGDEFNPRDYYVADQMRAYGDARAAAAHAVSPCGHPASLMLHSAETGLPLYCELCDDKRGRRDAEHMEQELQAEVARLRSALADAVAQEREACAKLCGSESVTFATRDMTRGALLCAAAIRARAALSPAAQQKE